MAWGISWAHSHGMSSFTQGASDKTDDCHNISKPDHRFGLEMKEESVWRHFMYEGIPRKEPDSPDVVVGEKKPATGQTLAPKA